MSAHLILEDVGELLQLGLVDVRPPPVVVLYPITRY